MPMALPQVRPAPTTSSEQEWTTIVWDDPVNLMSYVTMVFMTYFGYGRARAQQLMMQVHTEGRAVVSRGSRDRMEADVAAMHRHGLRATLGRGEGSDR
ncbi:ATP-dependent Clp protease adapter ClpS [Acidipropionibacterium timonense]